jgi:DNA-binding response OmpR family regulator
MARAENEGARGAMAKILLIDPDVTHCDTLRAQLEREGHDTLIAYDGTRGLELAQRGSPDLVILEVNMPGLDGFAICRMLRFESDIHIVILTACDSEANRITGLDLGADDYVIKPFLMGELMARIRARLRRGGPPRQTAERELLTSGDLSVDVTHHRVYSGDREVELVPKEFDLLVFMMRNRGVALSRELLLTHVWGDDFRNDRRTVDVHISYLRSKIEPDAAHPHYIQTVHRRGYRFADGTQEARTPQASHKEVMPA